MRTFDGLDWIHSGDRLDESRRRNETTCAQQVFVVVTHTKPERMNSGEMKRLNLHKIIVCMPHYIDSLINCMR